MLLATTRFTGPVVLLLGTQSTPIVQKDGAGGDSGYYPARHRDHHKAYLPGTSWTPGRHPIPVPAWTEPGHD